MTADPPDRNTAALPDVPPPTRVRRFRLHVTQGSSGQRTWESSHDRCSIGSDAANEFVLADATVSRFHCEIRIDADGPTVRDLGSRNGTSVDGLRIKEAYLRDGSLIELGTTLLRFELAGIENHLPLSSRTEFGSLVGQSVAMRQAFAVLERAAPTDVTVLLEGESGTGKEGAAVSLHENSPRRDRPFVIVDCGALPPTLLESELFGHERGAFTGATDRRIGAFEEASGGTIFLDEIGELPLDMQPKLLAVLERRRIRRLGGNDPVAVDVRVIAATNRDLRREVNVGRFRADLYFRLAVVTARLPPLRERPDDLPQLIDSLLRRMHLDAATRGAFLAPELLSQMKAAAWPGNVRELRNYLERSTVLGGPELATSAPAPADEGEPTYEAARRQVVDAWERPWLEGLLSRHGSVEAAARAAGVGRGTLYRLMRRHGLMGKR